jgi:hypothetical protein
MSTQPKTWTLTIFSAAAAAVAAIAAGVGSCGSGADCTFALDGAAVSAPAAAPSEPAPTMASEGDAGTHAWRETTLEQARALDSRLGGRVIWIEADCCDENAVAIAMQMADGLRESKHLGLDAPVIVTGDNAPMAAVVARSLVEAGHRQVLLVTH